MRWRTIRAIALRDLRILAGSKPVIVPIIVVPLIMFVGLPILLGVLPQAVNIPTGDLDTLVGQLPATVVLPAEEPGRTAVLMLVYLIAPLYLIVPIMVAAVVAADSIAGERERRTLEGLLVAPITDRELLGAKVLVSWVPAVAVGVVGAVIYGLVANLALAGHVDRLPFPNVLWMLLAVWVGPAAAAVALSVVVIISARVKGFQEAYQLGGVVVLPVIVLMLAQVGGVLFLGPALLAGLGAVLWIVAAVVIRVGARSVERTRLAERL